MKTRKDVLAGLKTYMVGLVLSSDNSHRTKAVHINKNIAKKCIKYNLLLNATKGE